MVFIWMNTDVFPGSNNYFIYIRILNSLSFSTPNPKINDYLKLTLYFVSS